MTFRKSLVVAVFAVSLLCPAPRGHASDDPVPIPRVVLYSAAGVTPESLATAGFTVAEVGVVASQLDSQAALVRQLLLQREAVIQLAAALEGARSQLLNSPVDPDLHALVAGLDAEHHQAVAHAEAVLVSVRALAFESLPSAKVALAIRYAEAAGFRVEPPMRIAALTESEFRALEQALRAEERALRVGGSVPHSQLALLMEVRSRIDVIAASSALAANIESIRAALSGHP